MPMTRRSLWSLLPAAWLAGAVQAQQPAAQPAAQAAAQPATGPLSSAFFPFAQMKVTRSRTGSLARNFLKGKIATGEAFEAHETVLPVGGTPHPPHHHSHSEVWLICEGRVEIMINGKKQRLGPGSAAFASSNEEHSIHNVGKIPARYFVVSAGPGADGVH